MSRFASTILLAAVALGCGRLGFEKTAIDGMDAGPADAGEPADDAGPPTIEPVCGDGEVGGEEQCDDANSIAGDGCEASCRFSCESAEVCQDENPCNGTERCADHRCAPGDDVADGEPCETGRVCRAGRCAAISCGNAMLEGEEQCDDGNTISGDGCESDCTFSCVSDEDCSDGDVCNGLEMCSGTNRCLASLPPEDGALCDRDGIPDTRDLCLDGGCVPSRCGDRFVDADGGEDCDDGDLDENDGCTNECTFTCESLGDCADGNVCNGRESCDLATHTCQPGPPPSDGSPCSIGTCRSGVCEPLMIFDGGAMTFDAGAPDAGPPDAGPPDAGPPDAGPSDAGAPDAGTACARDSDCRMGELCCASCPGDPNFCWSGFVCPSVLCVFDGGIGGS